MAKINAATVDAMREVIARWDTDEHRTAYRERRIPRADSVTDIDMRYRWDLYRASGADKVLFSVPWSERTDAEREFYDSLKTAHIDTALRKIVPAL